MRIGMVGLGRMGANMAVRLLRAGHEVVAYDLDADARRRAGDQGAHAAASLEEVVAQLRPPRAVWVMVPAGPVTGRTVSTLAELLEPGDVLVDGGNSRYTDSVARASALADKGIRFVDVGTSGGVWGLREGYCLMVGGEPEAFAAVEPALAALAPEHGYARVGPPGAGHFVKMVHNGVEYALMQAYGEGFELLDSAEFDLDLGRIAELWRHGSVVRSWLLDLAARALAEDPTLERLGGHVEDSGEGRWTVQTAVEHGVAAPTITLALFARFSSRQRDALSNRLLAALRQQFGGHAVRGRAAGDPAAPAEGGDAGA